MKISPVDKEAKKLWKNYSEARDKMLLKTNFKHSPWYVVDADKKNDAHIAIISHLLLQVEYPEKDEKMLQHKNKLVYSPTPEDIKDKLN